MSTALSIPGVDTSSFAEWIIKTGRKGDADDLSEYWRQQDRVAGHIEWESTVAAEIEGEQQYDIGYENGLEKGRKKALEDIDYRRESRLHYCAGIRYALRFLDARKLLTGVDRNHLQGRIDVVRKLVGKS